MTINWDTFHIFTIIAIILWLCGSVLSALSSRLSRPAVLFSLLGTLTLLVFIAGLWSFQQRPPLRTMGETRLWYSFFMGISGLITYCRWRYRWILSFTTVLSAMFCIINIVKPEIHDQSLMPALQSIWFIPHVTVYMFSYSILGCAFIIGCLGLFRSRPSYLSTADELVHGGTAFLTVGMLTGAIWAKEAWGNYWSWDPKETWALITWSIYLIYIHLRLHSPFGKSATFRTRILYATLVAGFLTLQMCWYGVNYLPAARNSVHLYNRTTN